MPAVTRDEMSALAQGGRGGLDRYRQAQATVRDTQRQAVDRLLGSTGQRGTEAGAAWSGEVGSRADRAVDDLGQAQQVAEARLGAYGGPAEQDYLDSLSGLGAARNQWEGQRESVAWDQRSAQQRADLARRINAAREDASTAAQREEQMFGRTLDWRRGQQERQRDDQMWQASHDFDQRIAMARIAESQGGGGGGGGGWGDSDRDYRGGYATTSDAKLAAMGRGQLESESAGRQARAQSSNDAMGARYAAAAKAEWDRNQGRAAGANAEAKRQAAAYTAKAQAEYERKRRAQAEAQRQAASYMGRSMQQAGGIPSRGQQQAMEAARRQYNQVATSPRRFAGPANDADITRMAFEAAVQPMRAGNYQAMDSARSLRGMLNRSLGEEQDLAATPEYEWSRLGADRLSIDPFLAAGLFMPPDDAESLKAMQDEAALRYYQETGYESPQAQVAAIDALGQLDSYDRTGSLDPDDYAKALDEILGQRAVAGAGGADIGTLARDSGLDETTVQRIVTDPNYPTAAEDFGAAVKAGDTESMLAVLDAFEGDVAGATVLLNQHANQIPTPIWNDLVDYLGLPGMAMTGG